MLARENTFTPLRAFALLAALVLLFAGAIDPADAKKKKKKKTPPVATRTATAPLLPASAQSATANCSGKTHIVGGGFSVSPPYSANGTDPVTDDGGTRSIPSSSQPATNISWSAGAAALSAPATVGTLTTLAQCESNTFGKLASISSLTGVVPPDTVANVNASCTQPNSHVIGGGFTTDTPGDLANPAGRRLEVLQSRRTSATTWTVSGVNPTLATSAVNVTAYVACEFNKGTRPLTEVSQVAQIATNGRTTASPSCGGGQHVVGGGFSVSPLTSGTSLPAVAVDQMQPVGTTGWQVGLYEFPAPFASPPTAALTAYGYCKPNKPPKKPKKKKKQTIQVVVKR